MNVKVSPVLIKEHVLITWDTSLVIVDNFMRALIVKKVSQHVDVLKFCNALWTNIVI